MLIILTNLLVLFILLLIKFKFVNKFIFTIIFTISLLASISIVINFFIEKYFFNIEYNAIMLINMLTLMLICHIAIGPQKKLKRSSSIQLLTWDDIIINNSVKDELTSIIKLLSNPKTVNKYAIELPKGIIFSGPPGNGKTTIAKIIANEANLNFFVVTQDKLISKYVGESEKNLTDIFNLASQHAPSIIFIDEIDAISRVRSDSGEQWSENLLNHFLQLLDGIFQLERVYVLAATNRPDLIDPALKRSGRLNQEVNIPAPDINARYDLFTLYFKKIPLSQKVNKSLLAEKTEGFSCADIQAVCNQSAINAFKREEINKTTEHTVIAEDIVLAINQKLKER